MKNTIKNILCVVIMLIDTTTIMHISAQDIVVLYDNDVHCAIDGYAKISAFKNDMLKDTPFVTTVSNGDFLQGSVMGTLTKGASIINIMNAVGYDYITLGNHEFDYGIDILNKRIDELNATVLNANYCHASSGLPVYKPYTIAQYGKTKIAFIGLTTPTSMEVVQTFSDDDGNILYTFLPGDEMETRIQSLIDKVRNEGADYVVVLAHLGETPSSPTIDNTSVKLIKRTHGIDAVLDGHAHSVIADSIVTDINGHDVHLTSTGTGFKYMGKLTITPKGDIKTELVDCATYRHSDAKVKRLIKKEMRQSMNGGKQVILRTGFDISMNDSNGDRAVRNQETALGNLIADAYRAISGADIALINGGCIRASIRKGKITKNDMIAVTPFLQELCTAEITGQNLIDALEVASLLVPEENGAFQHVSGMSYTIDTKKTVDIISDKNNQFISIKEGSARRLCDVKILNPQNNTYEPIDPMHIYTIVSNEYQLRELGSYAIFRYATNVKKLGYNEVEPVINYIHEAFNGIIPEIYSHTEGRITIK